jgi:signal transduction histidine kinase
VVGEDLLDVVLEEAVRSVGGDTGSLLMWDEQRQVLVPIRNTVSTAQLFTVLKPGQAVAGRAIQRMAVTVLDDSPRESGNETPAGESGARAAIGAPLVADGRLLGAVSANTLDPTKRFSQTDIQLFELYAGQAAAVINTSRLFESERRQRRGAEEAARAAAAIVSEMDEQRQLDLIIERAVTIVGGVAGGLNLIDPATGELVVRAPYGSMLGDRGKVIPRGQGMSYQVIDQRRPIYVADYSTFARPLAYLDAQAYGSSIGVPVIAHGQVLGALVVQSPAGGDIFTEADLPLVQVMADLAAVALENARILKQEQRRRQQLEVIRAVTAELTRELDLKTLLKLIMTRAGELVNSPAVSVLLWDESTATLSPNAWSGFDERTALLRFGLGEGVAGVAAQRREGIIVDDYRTWPTASAQILAHTDTRAVMGVPIVYQEHLIGALTASRFGPSEPFSRQELELLELFGAQAAIAIENARLFERATVAEALRELTQLKAEFLNTASHELRTPLSLIHGYAELLMHRAGMLSPSDVSQMSGEIYAGSQVLSRLVDDLLDFSRLAQGRLALHRRHLPLDQLLEQVARVYRAQPGGERIQTELQPGIDVEGDPERLRQIVGNLIANALTYAEAGPITVQTSLANGEARIEVTDAGPGLLTEEIDRVWETFYRGAEAAQLPNRGSGLGLTVVKQLVELHGGRVGVQSTPGNGATFWFTLPAAIATTALMLHDELPVVVRTEPPFRGARGLDDSTVLPV